MMNRQCNMMFLRRILIPALIFLGTYAFGQVGIQTNSPDASAALDIVATDKGLLIPRVTLTNSLSNPSPITAPAAGLLVFNTGANQTVGLYYWNGSSWQLFNAGTISTDYWNLSGNAGTTVGTHFIGTTDAEDFAIYTNNAERMRINKVGQGLYGLSIPYADGDFFTIEGNETQNYALNVYSPFVGTYISAGTYGLLSYVNNAAGYPQYVKNLAAASYGGFIVGSNRAAYTLIDHYAGLSSHGDDGIFTLGQATDGIGIIAGGSGVTTVSTIATGTGGAFTGYHGLYGKAVNASEGVGVIGVGNNGNTYNTTTNGSGGAFTGYHGLISSSTNTTYGTGVIGVGNGGSYYLYTGGSGGAFTGEYCGVAGWSTASNNSSYGIYGRYQGGGNIHGVGVYGYSRPANNYGYGVYGIGNKYGVVGYEGTTGNNNYGLYAFGDVGATGNKNFVIDHPLDPENKILKHTSIESPEVLNMYRGNVILNENGEGTIQLPDYFLSININFSYDLTPIGQKAPDLFIKTEIDENGEFVISGGNSGQKISWVVYAERNDLYMRQKGIRAVEIEKDEDERGKYLMPELYNQPPEKGIFYKSQDIQQRQVKSIQTVESRVTEVKDQGLKKQD